MNDEYARKELKRALDIMGNIDLFDITKRRYNQKNLNEAYSRLMDLYNLYKMEEEDDD